MFRIILLVGMLSTCFTVLLAQETSDTKTTLVIKAETEFSAKTSQLTSAETAKPGDDFNLTLTADLKGQEGTVIKGSEVYGRILTVEKVSEENSVSKVTIIFDFIKHGEEFITLSAVFISIERASDTIKVQHSKTIPGGTVLTLAGKDLKIDQDTVIRLKVTKDIKSGG